jgi:Sulfotransferase family/SEC-C motif
MSMTGVEQPVFILAPPRSGSTLLFETLSRCRALSSLGDEGHGVIERHQQLSPRPFSDDSNRLTEADLTPELAAQIRQDFLKALVDHRGRPLAETSAEPVRMLEKTPKNILRIPFFLHLYPDARFIYLYRDPLENISSIIDGWRSGRFATYRDKTTRHGPWSFLLPPAWTRVKDESLVEIATFQWASCHRYAIQDLGLLSPDRWCAVNFSHFLAHTEHEVQRLCDFIKVDMDDDIRRHCQQALPLSRYTLEQPSAAKWRRNELALASVLGSIGPVVEQINGFCADRSIPLPAPEIPEVPEPPATRKLGRNEPCHCGSGRRFKHCHGKI